MNIFDEPVKMIRRTNNYSKFEMFYINRDVSRINALERSMKEHSFFIGTPINVFKDNDKLVIKSGHHRFSAARNLGIPICYVICEESEIPDIYKMENSTNPWRLDDYLTSQVRGGNDQYHIVEEFHNNTGIPLGCCISLLAGNIGSTGNYSGLFKRGSYNIKDIDFANKVGDVVIFLKEIDIDFSSNNLFVNALSKCIRVKEFDIEIFKSKAVKKKILFEKQQSALKYLNMIDTIYNHASQKKIPLTFLAEKAARERSISCLSSKEETPNPAR